MYVCVKSLQLCLSLCNPMDCRPPDSSVLGTLQARILEWVAMPSTRGSSQPRDWTCISCNSCIAGRFFTAGPLGQPLHGYARSQFLILRGNHIDGDAHSFTTFSLWDSRLTESLRPQLPYLVLSGPLFQHPASNSYLANIYRMRAPI